MHQDDEDPFSVDQQALEEKLGALQRSFERWRALKSADAREHDDEAGEGAIPADLLQDEFRWLTEEIIRSLKSLTWELNDLHETLNSMLQHQPPASQLSPTTTKNRRLFISNTRALLVSIEAEVQPPRRQEQQQQQQQQSSVSYNQLPQEQNVNSAADADVELLLGADEPVAVPLPNSNSLGGRLLSVARRYKAALICSALILFAAFLLWVFYEAVLSSGQNKCVCTLPTMATSDTTASTIATDAANATVSNPSGES